ncbi:MAG: hypothetical protein BMS9Abin05_1483 [Rhodothermia bacterium]|nr:MAG: hypothetical protein BMS9Abin05_1483 [Rhodothermia bacterium]
MIGQTIMHYRITAELGQGGMGVVYKAHDTHLDRNVALKFLPPHLSTDSEAKNRFIHEAKAASSLDHPNICTIYDIAETEDGQLFIAMAYYEGQTLSDRLKDGPLGEREAVDIASQMANALARAHKADIVHRDIKPANIMLTESGLVKLLDFGIAKLSDATVLTQEGSTVGTMFYMSPEQVRGESVDARTDLWSLGVVLYEMLSGERPFVGDYAAATIYSILNDSEKQLDVREFSIEPELSAIVSRLLQKRRAKRFLSAEQLAETLLTLSTKNSVENDTDTFRAPSANSNTIRKHLLLGGIVLVIAGLIFAVLIVSKASKSGGSEVAKLAVLLCDDRSPIANDPYFSDGMTEDINTQLSKIQEVSVIGYSSVRQISADTDYDHKASRLGADYLVECSIRRSTETIRVTARLIDPAAGVQLWAEDFDRSLSVRDILSIQSEIAVQIANALEFHLSSEATQEQITASTSDMEAYDLYLRGRYLWNTRTEENLVRAIALFEEAISIDDTFVEAYSGLADSYSLVSFYGSNWDLADAIPKAISIATAALEIDSVSAEATASIALARSLSYNWEASVSGLRRATELDPSYATAQIWLSDVLSAMGRQQEALVYAQSALSTDPLSWVMNYNLGLFYYRAKQYQKAVDQWKRTYRLFPTQLTRLHDAYAAMADFDRAADAYFRMLKEGGTDPETIRFFEQSYADTGWGGLARARLDKLLAENGEYPTNYHGLEVVQLYAILGDGEKVIEWIEYAYEMNRSGLRVIGVEPLLVPYQEDSRFQDVLRKINLR